MENMLQCVSIHVNVFHTELYYRARKNLIPELSPLGQVALNFYLPWTSLSLLF